MKRTITILTVLTLLTGALFAADPYLPGGDTITLNATVKTVEPVFKFYGSMADDFASSTVVEGGGVALNTEKNPATDDSITAYFNITQDNLARYKGNLLITFKGTAFTAKVGGVDYRTELPLLGIAGSNDYYTTTESLLEITYPAGSSYPGHGKGQAEIQLNYLKASPIAANTRIMWISATWSKNGSLPASEDYTATVSVKIETTT